MESFCRGCLLQYNEPTDLLQYSEKSRRLFVYSTGLQVKRNDTFTFQLCKECYFSMKQSCKFKKQCRISDKKFKKYLMLKDDGDNFGSFIRNMDEDLSLRIPLASGHSTPAYQKNRDDDNESTCTSIRNFMTDIMEGEELPLSEARIIREVIQEEADVLEDSLDSLWLQDELSAGSDVDMDFGISPFATPRSVLNDHCYTPRRIDEENQRELSLLTFKEIIDKTSIPRIPQKFNMPILEDFNSNMDLERVGIPEEDKIKREDTENDNKDYSPEPLEFNNSIPSEVEDMVTENSISSTLQDLKTELLVDFVDEKQMEILEKGSDFLFDDTSTNIATTANENDVCIVLNQGIAEKKVPLTNELEYYVIKAELKKRINSTKDQSKEYHCTIDRNLDIALKYEESNEFSLDQLIISPAVSLRSGVSTPTIKNILFGNKESGTLEHSVTTTPNIENILFGEKLCTEAAPKYFSQVGQSIENLDDDDQNDDILEDLLKQNDSQLKDDQIEEVLKTKPETINFDSDNLNTIKENKIFDEKNTNSHIEVLEEFLRGADDPSLLNKDIIDQIIDPIEISDQDLFKRPLTPPYDKYDLEKCFCKLCNRTFPSLKSLKIHFTKIHKYKFPNSDPHRNKSQNNKVKMCNVCGKEVKGAANYVKHMKRHNDKRTDFFQCDNCKLFFNSRPALQAHMRMHMGIVKRKKEFVCPTCGKQSATSAHNKLHMRRHLKEFSVTCDLCHKGFYRNYDLQLHMRFHSGERPFTCEYCPKAFKRREQLYLHMKRHLGIVEKCDVCNMEFANKRLLARHYASEKCIKKRLEASTKSKHIAIVNFGKGSIETIRKMMQSSDSEKDTELDNDEIKESMVQSAETEKCIESKLEPSETDLVSVKSDSSDSG